jgi:alpha-D-xyloside xylohydrolase
MRSPGLMPFVGLLLAVALGGNLVFAAPSSTQSNAPEKLADGIVVSVAGGFLKIEVVAADVVRVAFAKDRASFDKKSLAAEPKRSEQTAWDLATTSREATVSTPKLKVRVDLASGAVSFADASGRPILAEKPGGKTLSPVEIQGEKTFHARQVWQAQADESLYGLGLNLLGLTDIKGYDLDLWQHNGTVAIPFLVSSKGYGIYWDNTSYTRFGDLRPWEPIPASQLYGKDGKAGGLTGSYYSGAHFDKLVATRIDPKVDLYTTGDVKEPNKRAHPDLPADGDWSGRWEGEVQADATGDYQLQTFSTDGVKMWVDDKLVMEHWRQSWLPWLEVARVRFEKGKRYRIRLEYSKDQGGIQAIQLKWKTPAPSTDTSLWSEVGDAVDYYFVYGPDLDAVVGGYRRVTGEAGLLPKWAFGLWQSRQRYNTQQESLDILEKFRARKIPVDVIVQDWFYWKEDQWGSHEFDPQRFPDPNAWIKAIHDKYNARLLISVWPKYYKVAKNFDEMQSRGFLYQQNLQKETRDWVGPGYVSTFYDAFNPAGREAFWNQIKPAIFDRGIDAWWLDASEPDPLPTPILDIMKTNMHPTALGSGSRMLNAYPLYHSDGVYKGQRSADPDKRVTILSRSAFAGQQRYGSATWSGDISSTWTALRKQVPAGVGFSISGIPYWTMDIGGFSVPARFSAKDAKPEDVEEWRELNTRWVQFGAFVPLFRMHGESPFREFWEFGDAGTPAYETMLKFDRLRYRLLPYVYSLAGQATHEHGTMMRPLVMDFRDDAVAREVTDQFLFGSAFLVNPVTSHKARSRSLYLPKAGWYDFWTGAMTAGGKTIDAPAPFETLPVFVRAGSIVPTGPDLQYALEKPADPVTLYVYTGADGAFTLYEDDGLTYGYEKGAFARIPLRWDEKARTLTIGNREGSFPGMLSERTFQVIFVSKDKPVGFSFDAKPDRSVRYSGQAVSVKMG